MERIPIGTERKENFEVLRTPEISVREENGLQLLSTMQSVLRPKENAANPELAERLRAYAKTHPLPPDVSAFLKKTATDDIDEEVLSILALTFEHPERMEAASATIAKHKSYIQQPENLREELVKAIESFEAYLLASPLADALSQPLVEDARMREEGMEETKRRIESLIAFFKPGAETSHIDRIILVPTDPFSPRTSGTGFQFGNEFVLKTNIENPSNLEHEFLHGVINPIAEKLEEQLTPEQKNRIIKLASPRLRQHYGDHAPNLLAEQLIRTYINFVETNEHPPTKEEIKERIASMDEERFRTAISDSGRFRAECSAIGIRSLAELKKAADAYAEETRNQLQEIVFRLYREYLKRDDLDENFEQFALRSLPGKL